MTKRKLGASEDERLIARLRDGMLDDGGDDLLMEAAARLTALREELARYKNDDEVRDMVLIQAEDFARDETRRAAIAEAECARLQARCAELGRLLEQARDNVSECVQVHRAAWGERLMHKQQPDVDLLALIDAALAAIGEGN